MDAPIISNLRLQPLTPEVSGRPGLYEVTATVTDPDGDLVGGRVEVRLVATGETAAFTIDAPFPGDRLDTALLTDPLPPGRFDLVFTVTDAAGHRSNEVGVSIAIAAAELRSGTTPGAGSRPSGAALDGFTRAR